MAEDLKPVQKPAKAPAAAPTGEQPVPRATRTTAPTSQPATVTLEAPVGIPGAQLKTAPRVIGADEPPPLPPNSELKSIGKPTPRVDGRLKVTGAAKYTADVNLPGMLYGVMVTSPHPHARIRSIDI